MKLFSHISLIFCAAIILTGCNNEQTERPQSEVISDFKALNSLLYAESVQKGAGVWPFTDEYLAKKDALLNELLKLNNVESNERAISQLLKIEQRFTERFFPWPYNANPLENYSAEATELDEQAMISFVLFTQASMEKAYQDKVRMSFSEINGLQQQIEKALVAHIDSPALVTVLKRFNQYITDYLPRRSPGIGNLPNGKDWYQARLNYFVKQAMAPKDVLNRMLLVKPGLTSNPEFIRCFTSSSCANKQGLDWRTEYSDRLKEYAGIKYGLEQAIIAEVDFGVHAQAWSSEHAITVLSKELNISKQKAEAILAKILAEPGLALVNFPLD